MHFVLQTPSLQHIAGMKIVAHLWNQPDILTQIARTFNSQPHYENTKKWKEIEEKVRNKVWVLPLPKRCKQHLSNFIKPLGIEIIHWCHYHNLDIKSFKFLDTLIPRKICWTMRGAVDYAKTGELMVKDESMDVERRYEIACFNRLDQEAWHLFQSLGEERGREYVSRGRNLNKLEQQARIAFSTRILLSRDASELNKQFHGDLLNKQLIKDMLGSSIRAMKEYHFEKLSQQQKERISVKDPMKGFFYDKNVESPTGNLLYYLSLQNEEQQESMFRKCIYGLLIFLLRWPLQSLFVEATECGWKLMGKKYCAEVLYAVITKIKDGFRDYDYSQLFWACWRLSRDDYKQDFLNNTAHLERLFATNKEEFILLVFNQAPLRQLKFLLDHRYDKLEYVLMDESVMSDAVLMEYKQTAVLNSSKEPEDAEKRLRSEHVSLIINIEMERRTTRRSLV